MADRPFVPQRPDERPAWRPPFRGPVPNTRPAQDHTPPLTSVRLRDGDREIEVSGGPGFVRQILDELPVLLARLRGDPAPTPASIRMPSPSPQPAVAEAPATAPPPDAAPTTATGVHGAARPDAAPITPRAAVPGTPEADDASVEEQVLAALRGSSHPLPISAIRQRLGDEVTGQQVPPGDCRADATVQSSGPAQATRS